MRWVLGEEEENIRLTPNSKEIQKITHRPALSFNSSN